MSRRTVLTAVVALSAFGLTAGLTASLGVATDQLGADTQTVAACDSAIDLSYGVTAGAVNTVAAVSLDAVDASCDGQAASLTLLGGGVVLESVDVADLAVTTGSATITLADTTDVEAVDQVSLVITGADATP